MKPKIIITTDQVEAWLDSKGLSEPGQKFHYLVITLVEVLNSEVRRGRCTAEIHNFATPAQRIEEMADGLLDSMLEKIGHDPVINI